MGPACDLPEFRTAPGENQSYTITNLVDATGRGNPTTSAYSLVLTYSVDVWAYPLYIVEGQISNVTTSGTSTTLSTFTNPLVATSTSPSSSRGTSSTSNLPPKGLTPGPKAGIAVAISISFVLLVLGIFFHFRRRGQQRSRSQEVAILEINSVADTLFADSNRNGDRTEQQSNHQNDRAIIQSAPYETKPPEYRSSFSRGRASPRSPQSDIYHATDEPAIQGPPFGSKISAVAASANQSPHTYCPHQPHASDYRLGGRADYTSSSCPHCNE
ncbi:hypothetical protein BDZ45DRAFT_351099 [Acephala macrosclerotiorum]|nr:hypothetical protein BDZ45DRAFT_351099 [Acephala macrosclerotiorum]